MFAYAATLRDRYTLRLNEDGLKFAYWHQLGRVWKNMGNFTVASNSAAIRGSLDGTKITVSSRYNVEQVIMMVNLSTNKMIGSIVIDVNGSIKISALPTWDFGGRMSQIPEGWLNRLALLVGVTGPCTCTINIRDVAAEDEDILRLKNESERWFIPGRYTEKTAGYDIEKTERDVIREQKAPTVVNGREMTIKVEEIKPKAEPKDDSAYNWGPEPLDEPGTSASSSRVIGEIDGDAQPSDNEDNSGAVDSDDQATGQGDE